MKSKIFRSAFAVAALVMTGTAAFADMVMFKADLKGATEMPAVESKGTGSVAATLDTVTKKLSWTITYSDLSGAAIAAHFHGPAGPNAAAPPVVPLSGDLKSPIKGEATLTDAQIQDLQGGMWYFNIHTPDHKGGEVRGQLMK